MTASEALGLLGLFMPGEVGYIEDPRNEGTETVAVDTSLSIAAHSYIEDPRKEGLKQPHS